jgi:hypothetical protein
MTEPIQIVTIDGISFDGESFTIERTPTDQDILISNTEGPINLKTLCRSLGIPQLNDYTSEQLSNYEFLNSYIKSIFLLWSSIKEPLLVNKCAGIEALPVMNENQEYLSDLPDDIVDDLFSQKDMRSSYLGLKHKHQKGLSHVITSYISTSSMSTPVTRNIENFKFDESKTSSSPFNVQKNIKKSKSIKLDIIEEPLVSDQKDSPVNTSVLEYVQTYIESKGHQYLEGKDIRKISNTIARLKPKSSINAQKFTDDIFKAILHLNSMGIIQLSTSKEYVAPYIPPNIEDLQLGGESAEYYMNDLYANYTQELSNIHFFTKMVNMIANSCLRKLCKSVGNFSPAYYAAAKFINTKIYTHQLVSQV